MVGREGGGRAPSALFPRWICGAVDRIHCPALTSTSAPDSRADRACPLFLGILAPAQFPEPPHQSFCGKGRILAWCARCFEAQHQPATLPGVVQERMGWRVRLRLPTRVLEAEHHFFGE